MPCPIKILLFRFGNIMVSHHAVSLTFYNKIAPMLKPICQATRQRCTESEIFDSDSAPPSAEYTPTLHILKF